MSYYDWRPYVSVAERRAKALREMEKLRKKGTAIQPVQIEGRKIARSFWGNGWCEHLESFSDYSNRLPRGRTYVRNGSVCHLEIRSGVVEAIVSGSELYNISIRIEKLPAGVWETIKKECTGQIGSVLELLRGKLSEKVMRVVTDRRRGLFPQPGEIKYDCGCPDWASMCKHLAAVFYGIGNRLDTEPELLFLLRGVDPAELISSEFALPMAATGGEVLADDELGGVFGIDLDMGEAPPAAPATAAAKTSPSRKGSKKPKPAARAAAPATKGAAARKTSGAPKGRRPPTQPTGKSVAQLRKKLDLSVTRFAKLLEVSPPTVTRWEAAKGRLKLQERTLKSLDKVHRQVLG